MITLFSSIKDSINLVGDKYNNYLRKKAIIKVNEKLLLHKLKKEEIEEEEYETMVYEEILIIKKEHAQNTVKGLLIAIGLDSLVF